MKTIDDESQRRIGIYNAFSGLLYAVSTSLIISLVNYYAFNVPFKNYETISTILCLSIPIIVYRIQKDYLNPLVYFPVLYFLLYWLGDFDFNLGYPMVTNSMWFLYFLGILGFYTGAFAMQSIHLPQHNKKMVQDTDGIPRDAGVVLLIFFAITVLAKMVIFAKGGIPIFSGSIDAIRESAAEDFGVIKVVAMAYPIITVFFICDCILRRSRKQRLSLLFLAAISVSLLLSLLDGSRLLIIEIAIPVLIYYFVNIRRAKLRTVMIVLFLGVLFISGNKFIRNILENPQYLPYIAQNRSGTMFANVLLSGFSSFRVAIDSFQQLVHIVPSVSDYTHGQMFMNSILSVLPGKQVIIGYYVRDLLHLNFSGMGAATTILGMFYLDGGPILCYFGMAIFGALIQFNYANYVKRPFHIYLSRLEPVYIVYYSIYCLRTNVMPTIDPILSLIYYWMCSFLIRHIRKSR